MLPRGGLASCPRDVGWDLLVNATCNSELLGSLLDQPSQQSIRTRQEDFVDLRPANKIVLRSVFLRHRTSCLPTEKEAFPSEHSTAANSNKPGKSSPPLRARYVLRACGYD